MSARRDRVVEVAVARVDATGRVEDEFATLINPDGRDVGPTFIHGITNQHVKSAPRFAEVVPELLERMSGAVVVAHNATFEEAFLAQEFERAGVSADQMPALCTLCLGAARLPSDGMPVDDAAAAYLDALGEVLSDGKLTGDEAKLLAGLAGSAGMGGEQVSERELNHQFLDSMKQAALDDETLTATELRQLRAAAKALSLPEHFGDLTPTAPEPPTGPAASEDGPEHTPVLENGSRAERAQHTLGLQRAGHSRAEIAARLAVS